MHQDSTPKMEILQLVPDATPFTLLQKRKLGSATAEHYLVKGYAYAKT